MSFLSNMVLSPSLARNKPFLFLFTGRVISQLGDKLYLLALPWFVLEITGSVVQFANTMALELLPALLFSPFIGVWVDRADRKKILILSDISQGLVITLLVIAVMMGFTWIGLIYITAFLLSILTLLFEAATDAYMPSIVAKEDITEANAKLTMVATIMRVIGPALAGFMIGIIGSIATIAFNGLTFFLSALFLSFVPNQSMKQNRENSGSQTILHNMKEGFVYLVTHPVLMPIAIFSALINISIQAATSLFIFESKEIQGYGAFETSTIFWVSGLFSFFTTLIIKPVNNRITKGQMIRYGALGVLIGIGILLIDQSVVTLTISYTLLLAIGIFVGVSMMSLRQEIVPTHLLGRVMTANRMINNSLSPLAILLGGYLANRYSPYLVYLLSTLLVSGNVLYAWLGKIKDIK
ncbi:MFS transporter [Microaerobacter geothermalis]|uniref:MFS transporter n=1 Tax=Microaerobacter geothermalis TaxID=674972 RepID=UPI001F22937C|nr:MFS transporter [Microaerobacter geothermalis]MCF6092843.1 MFS transporter [Microaerobacter geothermalis]